MAIKKNKGLITTIGIIGSIASIIGLIIFFIPRSKNLELAVTTSLVENLTESKLNDPDLKAIYLYKGDTINNLWRVLVEFKNESHETFVISEKVRNVLEDTLKFGMADNVFLIDRKMVDENFPNRTFILRKANEFGITFQQWRSQESVRIFFYVQTKDSLDVKKRIFNIREDRPIINGDIKYYYESIGTKNNQNKTSIFPSQIRGIAYVIVIITLVITLIVLFIMMITSIIGFYKRKEWRRNELSNYNNYINTTFKDKADLKTHYLNNPDKFYTWSDYKGPRYPELTFDYGNEKVLSLFFAELVTLIGAAVISVVIFDLIIFFP